MNGVDIDQVTVLVVTEHGGTPEFLAELARNERYRPLGRVTSVEAALDVVREGDRERMPDVVLAEVLTLNCVEELAELARLVPVVVVSTLPPDVALLPSMAGGARGFVWKPIEPGLLDHAVTLVAAGHLYVDPRSSAWLVDIALEHHVAKVEHGLTLRQSQVLQLVRVGLTNKAIARALGVSNDTVKTHLQEAMRKLGVHDRRDAAARATVRLGRHAPGAIDSFDDDGRDHR